MDIIVIIGVEQQTQHNSGWPLSLKRKGWWIWRGIGNDEPQWSLSDTTHTSFYFKLWP